MLLAIHSMARDSKLAARRSFLWLLIQFIVSLTFSQELFLGIQAGHTSEVLSAGFSPDGQYVATSSKDGLAKVWDFRTGKLIFTLRGHTKAVNSVCFGPDGSLILTASDDQSARIWDAKTGSLLHVLDYGHQFYAVSAVFSPDGRYALVNSIGFSSLWEVRTGNFIRTLQTSSQITVGYNDLNGLFSPDGRQILTACYEARIWNFETGERLLELDEDSKHYDPGDRGNCKASYSPDGRSVLTVDNYHGVVRVWDARHGKLLKTLKNGSARATTALFNHGGDRIAVAYDDHSIHFYNQKWKKVMEIRGDLPKSASPFSPDDRLFTGISGNRIVVWDAKTGYSIQEFEGHHARMTTLHFCPGGEHVFSSSENGDSKIWNLKWRKVQFHLVGDLMGVYSVDFSPDGQRLALACAIHETRVNWLNLANYGANPSVTRFIDSTSALNSVKVMDQESQQPLFELKGFTSQVRQVKYSPDGTKLAVVEKSGKAGLYHAGNGEKVAELPLSFQVDFSPDGTKLAGITGGSVYVWKVDEQEGLLKLQVADGLSGSYWTCSFSADGKKVLACDYHSARVWDAESGQLLLSVNGVWSACFGGNDSLLTGHSRAIRLWHLASGRPIWERDGHSQPVSSVRLSPDGSRLLSTSWDGKAKLWELTSGKLLHELPVQYLVHQDSANQRDLVMRNEAVISTDEFSGQRLFSREGHWVKTGYFSADGNLIITLLNDGSMVMWDALDGSWLSVVEPAGFHSAQFNPSGNTAVLASAESGLVFMNTANGHSIANQLHFSNGGQVTRLNSLYFQASTGLAEQLYAVDPDRRVITFEQLERRYNRPDLVLESFGTGDSALLGAYREAYQKRLRRLGIDSSVFSEELSIPEAQIVNRNEIDFFQYEKRLTLHLQGFDTGANLKSFNILINETPLFGKSGLIINAPGSRYFDTTLSVELSAGENRIEFSVINQQGIESYRYPLLVDHIREKPVEEKLYFVGIGIDHFAEPGHDLSYSVKDIRDLAAAFRKKYGMLCSIDTLFDAAVTVENVLALKEKLLRAGVNDRVVIAYSGHGLISSGYEYYLSTYSVQFSDPANGGLPYEMFEDLLEGVKSRRKLILIDACHSGILDKEEFLRQKRLIAADSNLVNGSKGAAPADVYVPVAVSYNSFELMNSLFLNLDQGHGATIISASSGTQFAYEKGELRNGVFTYSILRLMNEQETLTVNELKWMVIREVEQMTHGLQKPTSRMETNAYNWILW